LSAEHDVKLLCRILKVPRSTYYATINRPESKRSQENREYCAQIKEIWRKSRKCYGSPKIAAIMRRNGILISQKRVGRLMVRMSIRSVVMRKYRHYSSIEDRTDRENIINQEFGSDRPNERWATDITYIKTRSDGWTYLASVVDLCTKRIVGFKYAKKMTADVAIAAIENALHSQGYPRGVILHSDQGCQYTCEAFAELVNQYGLIHSFSKRGCPYDNAVMESFHATLKKEEVNRQRYRDYSTASLRIFDYIEGWYNRTRLHSSIGYRTPVQFENELKMDKNGVNEVEVKSTSFCV
jgi:putative transposase